MGKKEKIIVFSDFDGTIVVKDIGDEIFKVFGQFEPYHSKLRSGELLIRDYWRTVCNTLKPGIKKEDIQKFALDCETDPNFPKFVEFCKESNIELFIVSDGFDVYIEPITDKLGYSEEKILSNKMLFNGKSKPEPFYPRASESCNCMVASCKRNAILENSGDDDIIVYIGDGYSDFCAAEHSDIVFAKKELAAYCNEKKIPHYPFSNFFDVYKLLSEAIRKGKVKQRNQSRLLRKKAFEIE